MTTATKNALEHVSRILHDAGWDAADAPPPLGERDLDAAVNSLARLLRPDDWTLLQEFMGKGKRAEDAGRVLGLGPDESRSRLSEAVSRLRQFSLTS